MSELTKVADLEPEKPDVMTDEGMRAFYIKHGIDPDEMERRSTLARAPGPIVPGGTGPAPLHEDELDDLERIGWRGRPAKDKE